MNVEFHNALLVLPDQLTPGAVAVRDGLIHDVQAAPEVSPEGAENWQGDYLFPGLVELHTDNIERHVIPRPKTFWPNLTAAAVAHDAEMAASGVTTVYDSMRVGAIPNEEKPQNRLFLDLQQAVHDGHNAKAFRVNHRLHIRCELTDPEIMTALEPAVTVVANVRRVKLMQ